MTSQNDERRDSQPFEREVITDPLTRAQAEIDNGFRQYDAAVAMALDAIDRGEFRLRPSSIMALHREALRGISRYAGNYRTGPVIINKSRHVPPDAHLVPMFVEDMCDHVNEQYEVRPPLFRAASVMWRLNWIHPFEDGNGRTARLE